MTEQDVEIGARPAAKRRGEAGVVTQIGALLKKNMRVHTRTNALPCCSCCKCPGGCIPVSACVLHFCCPIFFVAMVTALPWIIINAVANEEDRHKFLDVVVTKPQVPVPWPSFEVATDKAQDNAPYRLSPESCQMYGFGTCTEALFGTYLSAPPFLTPLFENRAQRTVLGSGTCEFPIESCHCQTLAIVGPGSVTAPFKSFMQERYDDWESVADTLHAQSNLSQASHLADTWAWRVITAAFGAKVGFQDSIPGARRMAEAPLPNSGFWDTMLEPLKRHLPSDPADVARRLQPRAGQQHDRLCDLGDWEQREYLWCDVDEGHDKPIFRTFSSIDEVDSWINSEGYGRYSRDRSEVSPIDRLCGAVVFENEVLSDSAPAYTIRLNVTFQDNDVSASLTNRDIDDGNQAPDQLRWYMQSGFLQLQYLVQRFIGRERTGDSFQDAGGHDLLSSEPHFVFAPTSEERVWVFGRVVNGFVGNPVILSAMFGPIVSSIAFYASRERATRQRELMRMMGLSDSALIWSWISMFVVLNIFVSFFQALFFEIFFFKKTGIFLIWVMLWFFANAVTTFGMCVSAFITSDRLGAMGAFGLFFGLSFTAFAFNAYDSHSIKVLWSLIPNNAFVLCMTVVWDWELRGVGVSLGSASQRINNYAMADGIGMLFLDFWLLLAIYYYADNVIPWHNVGVPRKPWFCFMPAYWHEVMGKPPVVEDSMDDAAEFVRRQTSGRSLVESEDEPRLRAMVEGKRCVTIRNLHKRFWNASGQEIVAVNNLSLTMYQDECFCLLGHNGAGKTTTMMMLTGCMPQTSGQIEVNGARVPEEIRSVRSSMGFCPQHNVLIDELTVMEHLELFGTIAGMTMEGLKNRGQELLGAVSLLDKIRARSSALSGGMKRKLSCALAFLSEPYLVILDEPSSGMDPFARRGMWDTLKRWRTGHILCLTTHYMDEADALGDRIAIMAEGKLACSGTSTFLKKKFGLGYVIAFVKCDERATQDAEILHVLKGVIPDVEVMSSVGKELLIQVPFASAEHFPMLFPLLDSQKRRLGIEAYGTSITNLEEVFLRAAKFRKAEEEQQQQKRHDRADGSVHLVEGGSSTRQASFLLQVYALLLRRILFGYRNWLTCACQICLPMCCMFVFCLIVWATTSFALQPLVLGTTGWNIDVDGGPKVPITVGVANPASAADFRELWRRVEGVDAFTTAVSAAEYKDAARYQFVPSSTSVLRVPDGVPEGNATVSPEANDAAYGSRFEGVIIPNDDVLHGIATEAGSIRVIQSRAGAQAASQYGSVLYPNTSSWCPAQGQYPGVPGVSSAVLPTPQLCSVDSGPTLVSNVTSWHSSAIMYNLHAEAVLKGRAGSGVDKLRVTNHPFQKTRNQQEATQFLTGIFAATIIMASYGFIPSGATSYVVMEKERDVKNQLVISGCSHLAYWTSNFIFDTIWGILPCVGAIVIFFIFRLDTFTKRPGLESSIALFAMYLPATAGFAYLFAFLFSKAGVALFVSWIFNMLFGILATTLVSVLASIEVTAAASVIIKWICRFVPVFSLGFGHLNISVKQASAMEKDVGAITGLGVGGAKCPPIDDTQNRLFQEAVQCTFMVGDEFLVLCITAVLFFVLTIFTDVAFGLPAVKKIFTSDISSWIAGGHGSSLEDPAVLDEKKRVGNVDISKQFVYVKDIHKVYNGKVHAVRGISFAAERGQVFGLLGVNGAGKTSTFKMLCGEVEPSAGRICIQGYDVSTNAGEARRLIGYCPQFDALLDTLTTREHLELYGRIKGLSSAELHSAVNQKLKDLDLGSYVYSRAGQLSGGNKRKTSVAMATIGEPPMVFLDEPSAGMDPVARRGMWSVIQSISDKRQKSVVILTTHSMEEAEALCSRIAIQVDGLFRCLGTAQQIKSRYGQGLELNVRLATPTPEELGPCAARIAEGCNSSPAQVLTSSDAASVIERSFEDGARILQEMRSRHGSPLSSDAVDIMLLSEWVLLAQRAQAFESFLEQRLRAESRSDGQMLVSLEKAQNVIRYQIAPAALTGRYKALGELFSLLQHNKELLKLEDYQLCQPSLEQIFNRFATTQIAQAAQQTVPQQQALQQQSLQQQSAQRKSSATSSGARVALADVDAVTRSLPGQAVTQWLVDNSELKAQNSGLGYRTAKDLASLASSQTFVGAAWGSVVEGVETKDGWLQVGQYYLPLELRGVRVIVPKTSDRGSGKAPVPKVIGAPREDVLQPHYVPRPGGVTLLERRG